MSTIVARLEITMDSDGVVNIKGVGVSLKNKATAYGLLELAKDIIRGNDRRIETPGSLS